MPIATLSLNDGHSVPWLAFGTGTAHFGQDVTEQVARAIRTGFTHIDGAQLYGNEDSLGAGVRAAGVPRSELFVTTKLGRLSDGERAGETLRGSLEKLQLEYVDLFLIHAPSMHSAKEGQLREVWRQMVQVKNAGLARSVGVSNFSIAQLEDIMSDGLEAPAVNQIEYHPFLFKDSKPLLAFHKKHGIVTASFGGLSPILPNRAGDESLAAPRAEIAAVLDKLRAPRGASQNQILLKWLQQAGILAVTTSAKEERLKEYLVTADLPDLTAEEVQAIDAVGSSAHFRAFARFSNMV